jgi:hypothetical protein
MSERSLNLISGAWVGEGPGTNNLRESQQTTPVEIEEYLEGPSFIGSKSLKENKIIRIHRSSSSLKDESPIQNYPEEDSYIPTTKPSNPDIIRRRISRDYDYFQLKYSFNEAVAETLKHFNLAKKSDLVNNGQINDMDTAHHLLASFREQIVKNDSSRLGDNVSPREAKKLNNQEQGMFKLLLQKELGLDFGDNVAGETNHKYFMFTVDRARLDRLGKNKITANQAS